MAERSAVRRATCAVALVSLLLGCQGESGPPGAPGATISTGVLAGLLSSSVGGPAAGVTVTVEPGPYTAVSDTAGAFRIVLPVGVYAVRLASPDHAPYETGASVVAGATVDLRATLTRLSPLVARGGLVRQAGFGREVALAVEVAGATGPLAYAWEQVGGPTAVTLSSPAAASPTFTTASLAAMLAAGRPARLARPPRVAILALDPEQVAELTYRFRVTVSDGTFQTGAEVAVEPAPVMAGRFVAPRGVLVVANGPAASTHAWTLSAPEGSAAILAEASTRNPWFVPDVIGSYTLTEGSSLATVTLRADDWAGIQDWSCATCHPSKAAEWQATGHASVLRRGLDGALGPSYRPECLRCHTVGFEPGAQNGGFDDAAAALPGWQLPAAGAGAWDALPARLKGLAGVQCESCHGPGTSHLGTPATMFRPYQPGVCATCHQAQPYDAPALWSASAHASPARAIESATTARGASPASCGRCHAAQGFARWSEQLLAGDAGELKKPDGTFADAAYLQGLGLTQTEVQPVTCQACHDPHTLKLRVAPGATFTTPAGFAVASLGKGGLCAACHNSRNGAHDDAHAPAGFTLPHRSAQADVFMGRNAYFVSGDRLSDHAAIRDTCVGCHMVLLPASVSTLRSNHGFGTDRTICATCHGPGVTGETTSAVVEAGVARVLALAADGIREVLQERVEAGQPYRVRAWSPATDLYSSASAASSNLPLDDAPTAVSLVEVHGEAGVRLTLPRPVTVTWSDGTTTTVTEVTAPLGSLEDAAPAPAALFAPGSDLAKGLWNAFLVRSDGSGGMHNPGFTFEVLRETEAKLAAWRASPER